MTKTIEFDYSKMLNLLDKDKLKNIGMQIASEALTNSTIEYKEFNLNFKVPSAIVALLEPLTEIFPIEIEDIISNMATQGLNVIIQDAVKEPFQEKNTNPLDGVESMDIFSDKFSELTEVFSKITEMANIVENLTKTEEQINNKK
jgi:hypothetical protein